MASRSERDFHLLIVCTGNICRSPAAERLFRNAFTDGSIATHSAGTRALIGERVHPPMERLLQEADLNGEGFAARWLEESMIEQADLILTATREHRADVVERSPGALRRTFTVREFARLSAQVDPAQIDAATEASARAGDRLTALLPLVEAHRAQVPEALDNIRDPYQRSDAAYEESFAQIEEAVATIAQAVNAPAQ